MATHFFDTAMLAISDLNRRMLGRNVLYVALSWHEEEIGIRPISGVRAW